MMTCGHSKLFLAAYTVLEKMNHVQGMQRFG